MDIERLKNAYLSAGDWVEERHKYLMTLPKAEARAVLKALLPEEVDFNVNCRPRQQDYIADFLGDVWDISRAAFWRHVQKSCEHEDGILFDFDRVYMHHLFEDDMPMPVWKSFLRTLIKAKESNWGGCGDLLEDDLATIVFNQTHLTPRHADRQAELARWYRALDASQANVVESTLLKAFNGPLPSWLRETGN